jgi:hypothetical protein
LLKLAIALLAAAVHFLAVTGSENVNFPLHKV